MKIGILGSGIDGRTLANGFLKHGYDVTIGTRDPEKLSKWKEKAGVKGRVGSFDDAAAFGEIVELFGFEAKDTGGPEAARAIEPLCILWCIPGLLRNEWTHAFKLLGT